MKSEENYKAAQEWYKIAKEQNNQLAIEILENNFPELKESEDEKIRKEMLAFCERASSDRITIMVDKDTEDFKSWIAWLEKHKEQTPAEWSEEDERLQQCLIRDQEKCLEEVRNDKVGHSEIISDLKEMYHERIDWLKSLKKRIKGE